jgi:acetyl esterase/lipase
VPADLTLRYGPGHEQLVDVRLPAADGPRPVVVVVHGGFWKAEWDRAHVGDQSDALAQAGYLAATVEYRRVGQPGGGWTGTLDDIALVMDELPELLGGSPEVAAHADLDRCVLVGHSAGGHLALWSVARHVLPEQSRWHRPTALPVRGVVALAGVSDLALADRLHLGADATRALLDGSPAQRPDRYAEADPAVLLPTGVPVHLVHGTEDDDVPIEVSRSFHARAVAAGDPCELRELPGVGHMDLVEPTTPAWPGVLASIEELAR